MDSLIEDVVLSNELPDGYICVSKEFVRHPKGFAVGALVKSLEDERYYIFTGTRIAGIPQEYAKKFALL